MAAPVEWPFEIRNADYLAAKKFLGHQDINKTLIYARVFDETVRDQFATVMAQTEAIAVTDSLTGLFRSLNHRYPFRPRLDTRCNAQNLSGRSFCRDIRDRRAPGALAAGVYTNTAVIAAEGDLPAQNNTAVVTFTVANVAPTFTSAPVLTATQDAPYTYTIAAADPDLIHGDALTVTAITKPAWLTLSDHGDGTAALSGTPSSADVGEHTVVLRVTDSAGAFTEQSFTITVAEKPGYTVFLPLVVRNAP